MVSARWQGLTVSARWHVLTASAWWHVLTHIYFPPFPQSISSFSPVGTSEFLPFGANSDLPWDWIFPEILLGYSSLLSPVGVYYDSHLLGNYMNVEMVKQIFPRWGFTMLLLSWGTTYILGVRLGHAAEELGGRWGRMNQRERESRIGKDGGRETEMTNRNRDDQTEIWRIRQNVACNTIGKVPNAPLASTPGKEFHPPILSTLVMHGGQVKRERFTKMYKNHLPAWLNISF